MGATFETVGVPILQSQRDGKMVAGGATPGSTNLRNQALWRSARIASQANKPQTRSRYAFDSHLSSLSSGFFNQGSRTMARGGLSPKALRLSRRNCERNAGASSCHWRNRGPCSLAGGVEGNLLSLRCHARGEIGIIGLDQRRTPSQFLCLARGLRSIHGERPRFGKGQKLYFESGRASSEGDFSGRVSGVSGACFGRIRRRVFVVTGRRNSDSCAPSGHDKLEGRIQGLRSSLADPWLPSCRPSGTRRLRSSRSLCAGFAVPCLRTYYPSGTQRWRLTRSLRAGKSVTHLQTGCFSGAEKLRPKRNLSTGITTSCLQDCLSFGSQNSPVNWELFSHQN